MSIKKFKCEIEREVFSSDNFKIYGAIPLTKDESVDSDFWADSSCDLKLTRYGTITLSGNMPQLDLGNIYEITGEEVFNSKYGSWQYDVKGIHITVPKTEGDVRKFLNGLLTPMQVDEIMKSYPDIINICMEDRISEIDLSKLYNIGEYRINVIDEKIKNNYVFIDLTTKLAEFELSMSTVKDLYKEYKTVDYAVEQFYKNPYRVLIDLDGFGFKRADTKILKGLPNFINSPVRLSSAIKFSLEENQNNGHTYMPINNLKEKLEDLCYECISHFNDVIQGSEFVIVDEKYVIKKQVYEIEKYIAKKMLDIRNENEKVWEYDTSTLKEESDLTEEQINFINSVLKENVILLPAPGGTGKSHSLNKLTNILKELDKSYLLIAPTGKASKKMAEYTGEEAYTIHRGLLFTPEGFTYNEHCNLPYDVVILDESSMVDIFIFQSLLKAINPETTKLVMIGDISQIPSVSCGRVFNDIIDSKLFSINTFTKIFRYGEGGLYKVATNIRNGNSYFDKLESKVTSFGTNKDYVFIYSSQEECLKSTLSVYGQLINKQVPYTDIVITMAMNIGDYGSIKMNNLTQAWLKKNTEYLKDENVKFGDVIYFVGDIVMQTKNDYKAKTLLGKIIPVFNGSMGTIISIDSGNLIVEFDGQRYAYDRNKFKNMQLAYCVNIFKMQGSQAPYIILNTPKAHTYMMNRDLLYTAVSRTQTKCFHISDTNIIKTSLKKSASRDRLTLLKGMLQTFNKENNIG